MTSELRCEICGHTTDDDSTDDPFLRGEAYGPVIPRSNGMILCAPCEQGRQEAEKLMASVVVTVLADGCAIQSSVPLERGIVEMLAQRAHAVMTTNLVANESARWN